MVNLIKWRTPLVYGKLESTALVFAITSSDFVEPCCDMLWWIECNILDCSTWFFERWNMFNLTIIWHQSNFLQLAPTHHSRVGKWFQQRYLTKLDRTVGPWNFQCIWRRDVFSHLADILYFVKVPMRQQQQNQNRKKQPANLPKTVSRSKNR